MIVYDYLSVNYKTMTSLVERIGLSGITANFRRPEIFSVHIPHLKAQGSQEQSAAPVDTLPIREQIVKMFDRSVPLQAAIDYVSSLVASNGAGMKIKDMQGISDYTLMNDALGLIVDKACESLEIAEAKKNGSPPPIWLTDAENSDVDPGNARALQDISKPFQVAAKSILSEQTDSNLAASNFSTATASMLQLTAKVDNSGINGNHHINFGHISSGVIPALNRLAGVQEIAECPFGFERSGIYMSMNVIGEKLNGQLPRILEANPNLVRYCTQPITH